MKCLTFILGIVLYAGTTIIASAQDPLLVGPRDITSIACHVADGECAVWLSGPEFGAELGCAHTSARWDSFEPNGRAILALLTSAHMSGKMVKIHLSDCFANIAPGRPNVPTFDFMCVEDCPLE